MAKHDNQVETMSVPEAGAKYYGLSKNGSYDAAQRGEIPVIKVGRLLRVPIRVMERRLDNADDKAPR
jgi:excisionase family DNA binding protein